MQRYIAFLRHSPRPITIQQYNQENGDLLDPDSAFEHGCLTAWHRGRQQHRGGPGSCLTCAFPVPPRLRTLKTDPDQQRQAADVVRWGAPTERVFLTADHTRALAAFAAGNPPSEAIRHMVSPSSRAAVAAFLEARQHGHTDAPLHLPP